MLGKFSITLILRSQKINFIEIVFILNFIFSFRALDWRERPKTTTFAWPESKLPKMRLTNIEKREKKKRLAGSSELPQNAEIATVRAEGKKRRRAEESEACSGGCGEGNNGGKGRNGREGRERERGRRSGGEGEGEGSRKGERGRKKRGMIFLLQKKKWET